MNKIFGVGLMLLLFGSLAVGDTETTATGEGACQSGASCNNTDTSLLSNTFAGSDGPIVPAVNTTFNDWFAFDIPSIGSITNAVIYIYNAPENYTQDAVVYNLYDATSITYAGLQAGAVLGSLPLVTADNGVSGYVLIALDSTALTDLTGAEGGQIIFGGDVAGAVADNFDQIFGYTDGSPSAELDLNFTTLPEPGTVGLTLIGLGLLGLTRKRIVPAFR